MTVRVTVKLDKAKIGVIEKAQRQGLELAAEATLSDIRTSAVVPKNTGELERSGFVDASEVSKGKISIMFDTPYARRLYWHPEYHFRQDKNVNAQGKWMQSYIDGDKKKFTIESYSKFLKMLSKGLIK